MKNAAFVLGVCILALAPMWIFANKIDENEITNSVVGLGFAGCALAIKTIGERWGRS